MTEEARAVMGRSAGQAETPTAEALAAAATTALAAAGARPMAAAARATPTAPSTSCRACRRQGAFHRRSSCLDPPTSTGLLAHHRS